MSSTTDSALMLDSMGLIMKPRAFLAAMSIPKHHYETQDEAMTAARSIAMDTKHRMYVYPKHHEDCMYGHPVTFTLWHIRLGKGALQ